MAIQSLLEEYSPTVAASTYTATLGETNITVNYAGTCDITFPAASSCPRKVYYLRTISSNFVRSATSNVVPLAGGAAVQSILSNTAGKWAKIVSDGTYWQIQAAG